MALKGISKSTTQAAATGVTCLAFHRKACMLCTHLLPSPPCRLYTSNCDMLPSLDLLLLTAVFTLACMLVVFAMSSLDGSA